MVRKSRELLSHFVMTSERGGGSRKCTLNVLTMAYNYGSKHGGGSEDGGGDGSKVGNSELPVRVNTLLATRNTGFCYNSEESISLANHTS